MSTLGLARDLRMLLGSLVGPYSTGTVTVRATGADVALPRHSYALAQVGESIREHALVRLADNPDSEDHRWTVTSAGTEVAVEAAIGGADGNLPIGARLYWDPAISGVESYSTLTAAMTGGSQFGGIAPTLVLDHRDLTAEQHRSLFSGEVFAYPAILLSWRRTLPAGGNVTPASGPRTGRGGRRRMLFQDEWIAWIVSERLDSDDARSRESFQLRDQVALALTDRSVWRGACLSVTSHPIQLLELGVEATTPATWIDVCRFTTTRVLRSTGEASYNDWLTTRIKRTLDGEAGADDLDLPDILVPMS